MIENLTKNKDGRLRRCAAEALAKIGDMRSVDFLVAFLEDDDLLIASRAAYALGSKRDAP